MSAKRQAGSALLGQEPRPAARLVYGAEDSRRDEGRSLDNKSITSLSPTLRKPTPPQPGLPG